MSIEESQVIAFPAINPQLEQSFAECSYSDGLKPQSKANLRANNEISFSSLPHPGMVRGQLSSSKKCSFKKSSESKKRDSRRKQAAQELQDESSFGISAFKSAFKSNNSKNKHKYGQDIHDEESKEHLVEVQTTALPEKSGAGRSPSIQGTRRPSPKTFLNSTNNFSSSGQLHLLAFVQTLSKTPCSEDFSTKVTQYLQKLSTKGLIPSLQEHQVQDVLRSVHESQASIQEFNMESQADPERPQGTSNVTNNASNQHQPPKIIENSSMIIGFSTYSQELPQPSTFKLPSSFESFGGSQIPLPSLEDYKKALIGSCLKFSLPEDSRSPLLSSLSTLPSTLELFYSEELTSERPSQLPPRTAYEPRITFRWENVAKNHRTQHHSNSPVRIDSRQFPEIVKRLFRNGVGVSLDTFNKKNLFTSHQRFFDSSSQINLRERLPSNFVAPFLKHFLSPISLLNISPELNQFLEELICCILSLHLGLLLGKFLLTQPWPSLFSSYKKRMPALTADSVHFSRISSVLRQSLLSSW